MSLSKKTVRHYDKLHVFIQRLLKHHHPTANMTAECKDILNYIARDLSIRYINASVALCRYAKKATIDSNAIETLTYIWSSNPEELVSIAHHVLDVYTQNHTKGITKHQRAGLILPPARFQEMFRQYRGADQKISETSYIFLTAIIESVITRIIDHAVQLVEENKTTVGGLHVYRAIIELIDLHPLLGNLFIAGFGYIDIHLLDSQTCYLERNA